MNATEGKWAKNYKMYDYVTKELPALVNSMFPVNAEKKSITGHSMGGHGALICHLKNPGMYSAVSAFAPICNPTQVCNGHFLTAILYRGFKGPIFSEKYWHYFHCPKDVLRFI